MIFDIVSFEELDLKENPWGQRMDYVEKGVIGFREKFMQIFPGKFAKDQLYVSMKRQWPLNQLDDLQQYIETEVKHDTDGIIFTPLSMKYILGTCKEILKWKPIELNSVDFLALKINSKIYLTISHSQIGSNKSSRTPTDVVISGLEGDFEAIDNLDHKVLECSFDRESNAWKPFRIRTDKVNSNAYRTFIGVWESIDDDISFRKLSDMFKTWNPLDWLDVRKRN